MAKQGKCSVVTPSWLIGHLYLTPQVANILRDAGQPHLVRQLSMHFTMISMLHGHVWLVSHCADAAYVYEMVAASWLRG